MGDTSGTGSTPPEGADTGDQRTDDDQRTNDDTTPPAGDDQSGDANADDVDNDGKDQTDNGNTDTKSGATDDGDDQTDDDDGGEGDDSDDDLDEDDERLDGKVRRQLKAKNRENKRLRDRALKAEKSLLQIDVATKSGLPISIASRLVGDTEDELVADAGSLMEQFGFNGHVTPDDLPQDGGEGRDTRRGNPDDLDALAERIYKRD